MAAPLVPSGQVQPEEAEHVAAEIRDAMQLLATDASSPQVESAWDEILSQLLQRGTSAARRAQICTDAAGVRIRLYEQHGDQRLLNKGIALLEEAMTLATEGSTTDALASSYLGVAYGYQFDLTGENRHLKRATELINHSVKAIPTDSFRAPIYVLNLGLHTVRTFRVTGSSELLELAIGILTEAAKTRPGSPVYRSAAVLLAEMYQERYSRNQSLSDMEQKRTWDRRASHLA
ncbi:hypothetical protein [Rhizocola hellebori]|uniref:hypothetical protein n=1 Tax=Rhizocola hellebori TaxID=1392758 RepID=UPI0019438DF9|nr:hypothetical protein [Rhizocola hellebori]